MEVKSYVSRFARLSFFIGKCQYLKVFRVDKYAKSIKMLACMNLLYLRCAVKIGRLGTIWSSLSIIYTV